MKCVRCTYCHEGGRGLADRAGRDHTTVSRQVAKLEELGLVERQGGATDRVREAVVTAKGKVMTDLVDAARERIGRAIFKTWKVHDIDALVRLMRKFADAASSPLPATRREPRRSRATAD